MSQVAYADVRSVNRKPAREIIHPADKFSVWQTILAVLPLYLSWSLMSLIGLVDLSLAGVLGENAQSALGVADQVLFLMMLVTTGLCAGVSTLVCQSWGAGNLNLVNVYKRDGLQIAFVIGLLAMLAGLASAESLANIFCVNANAAKQAVDYIRICSLANLPWAIVQCHGAIFRGIGKAHLSTYQWLLIAFIAVTPGVATVLNIYAFQSLTSLAFAWVLASIVGAGLGQKMLDRVLPDSDLDRWNIASLTKHARDIFAVGGPVLIAEVSWLASNLILYALLVKLPDGAAAQVAWTVKLKVEETIAYAPLLACGMATAVLVGHQIGANNHKAARNIASKIAIGSSTAMFLIGCMTAWVAPYLVTYFINVPSIQSICHQLLVGSVLTFPLNAITIVLAAVFEGAGKTLPPMLIHLCSFFVVRVPVAWLLVSYSDAGVFAVWWAKCLSALLAAIAMIVIYKRIRWNSVILPGQIDQIICR
jgi:putative MATE family efflux protein